MKAECINLTQQNIAFINCQFSFNTKERNLNSLFIFFLVIITHAHKIKICELGYTIEIHRVNKSASASILPRFKMTSLVNIWYEGQVVLLAMKELLLKSTRFNCSRHALCVILGLKIESKIDKRVSLN